MIADVNPDEELNQLMQQDSSAANVVQAGNDDIDMVENNQADKENQSGVNLNLSSQDLLEMVDRKGLYVTDKNTSKRVDISTGHEAYFALLAEDMFNIANSYSRPMGDVHNIFYEVSCNRDKLIQVLDAQKKDSKVDPATIPRWQTLEDLALRHTEDTPSFQVVLKAKGLDEVNARKAFLEI